MILAAIEEILENNDVKRKEDIHGNLFNRHYTTLYKVFKCVCLLNCIIYLFITICYLFLYADLISVHMHQTVLCFLIKIKRKMIYS